jgi:hypothetical protein
LGTLNRGGFNHLAGNPVAARVSTVLVVGLLHSRIKLNCFLPIGLGDGVIALFGICPAPRQIGVCGTRAEANRFGLGRHRGSLDARADGRTGAVRCSAEISARV